MQSMLNRHMMLESMYRKCLGPNLLFLQRKLLRLRHLTDGSIALDNKTSVREILESYDEIIIEQEISERIYLINLLDRHFLFIAPFEDSYRSMQ